MSCGRTTTTISTTTFSRCNTQATNTINALSNINRETTHGILHRQRRDHHHHHQHHHLCASERRRRRHTTTVASSSSHSSSSSSSSSSSDESSSSSSGGVLFTLYGSQGSRSPLVDWYLHEKQIPFEAKDPHDVSNPHPFGQVPALRQNEDDVEVFESGAILLYLADACGELADAKAKSNAA